MSKPIDLPIGDAHGCATLKVLGIEAGPTVVADGLEKDLALVVAPEDFWGGTAEGPTSTRFTPGWRNNPATASRCPRCGGSKVPPKTAVISGH